MRFYGDPKERLHITIFKFAVSAEMRSRCFTYMSFCQNSFHRDSIDGIEMDRIEILQWFREIVVIVLTYTCEEGKDDDDDNDDDDDDNDGDDYGDHNGDYDDYDDDDDDEQG